MVRLWQWLTRRPAAKGDATTNKAVRKADKRWEKDGKRADQDYYHVPGAKQPDRTDPPRLEGVELEKEPEPARQRKAGHERAS